jgi:hypothetical protein
VQQADAGQLRAAPRRSSRDPAIVDLQVASEAQGERVAGAGARDSHDRAYGREADASVIEVGLQVRFSTGADLDYVAALVCPRIARHGAVSVLPVRCLAYTVVGWIFSNSRGYLNGDCFAAA